MNAGTKILLIDDDPGIRDTLQRVLAGEGCEVTMESRGDNGLARASQEPFNVVITDLKMPGVGGLELVRQLHEAKPRLPIILVTAFGTTQTAIEATKLGAYDYLLKPFNIPQLLELIRRAVDSNRLMSEPVVLGEADSGRDSIIGKSPARQEIYKEIGRIASKPVNVLIRGETGTGKELIARAIYQHSDRGNAPFIAINCAAIPDTLLESELFGHERGAFTGAEARRIGRFEQADRGTIFLDEIGDMSPGTQVKLMRVLQEKCLQRLGGKETIPVDVRLVAATNRNLEKMIEAREFREDLYYRLNVFPIRIPPLRERPEDIPLLVRYFAQKYGRRMEKQIESIPMATMKKLSRWHWPGNIRELENFIERSVILTQGSALQVPIGELTNHGKTAPVAIPNDSAERDQIIDALKQTTGRVAGPKGAAARLGVKRTTLISRMKKLGIDPRRAS